MPDPFIANILLRFLLLAVALILLVIAVALPASHAAEKAFRDAAQRNHPVQPDLRPMLPSNGGTRSGLTVVGHNEAPPLHAPIISVESGSVASLRSPKDSVRREEKLGLGAN